MYAFAADQQNGGGDVSFLGTLGKIISTGVKVGADIITGHPGNVAGDIVGAFKGGSPSIIPPAPGGFSVTPMSLNTFAGSGFAPPGTSVDVPQGFPGSVPTPGLGGAISRFLPGGQSGYSGAPPGYHINKRYMHYYRASALGHHVQDPTKQTQVKNVVVRNRKMNPLNPRALRRANSRQHAAVRLMRAAMKGTGWHITRHGFGAKKTRRR